MRKAILAAALLLPLVALVHPAAAQTIATAAVLAGEAAARDGDDILFGKVSVRLQGITAPEDRRGTGETGGAEATASLRALVEGRYVVCHLDGTTAGNNWRPAGICYLGDMDIGGFQVASGHARDCPAYSRGRYAEAEAAAKAAGRDLSAVYQLPPYCN